MVRLGLAMGVFLVLVPGALAEDCEAPCMGATITLELLDDLAFAADPDSLKLNSLQPEIEVENFFAPTDTVRLVARNVLEQVIDPAPGGSSTFEDLGLYTRELYGELTLEPFVVRAGKFTPVFSHAGDVADGFNAAELAANADMDESLGFEGAIDLGGALLEHRLVATAFTVDRSFLARSLFTERPVPELADGGAGNTSGLSSFSLVLDGCAGRAPEDCYEEGRFGYRIGIRYQRAGRQTAEDAEDGITPEGEIAALAAATGNFELGERVLRLIGEGTYLNHFEGSPDDAVILTGVAAVADGPMTYAAGLSRQWALVSGGPDTRQSLLDLSVKFEAEDDSPIPGETWSLQAGYTLAVDDEEQTTHTLGLKLSLELGKTTELQ